PARVPSGGRADPERRWGGLHPGLVGGGRRDLGEKRGPGAPKGDRYVTSSTSSQPLVAPSLRWPVLPLEGTREQRSPLQEGMLYVAHEAKTALSVIEVVLSTTQRSVSAGRLPSLTDLETARTALRRASALLEGALAYGGVRPPGGRRSTWWSSWGPWRIWCGSRPEPAQRRGIRWR